MLEGKQRHLSSLPPGLTLPPRIGAEGDPPWCRRMHQALLGRTFDDSF